MEDDLVRAQTTIKDNVSIKEKTRCFFSVGKVRWGMLSLVFLATTLNYVDRATLGVMQPLLAKAMNWTTMDYANINFWFQVGYAGGYALQGRFIDRIGVKKGFAIAVLVWSIAVAAHGLVASAVGFMICRFILGFAESGNYPSCVKATRAWFPASERGMAVGIFNSGTNVGAMLTPMLIPFLITIWGWQAAFYALAALGLLWLVLWLKTYNDPDTHPSVSKAEIDYIHKGVEPEIVKLPYARIIKLRATWAYIICYSLCSPVFWFYLYWLPPFLNKQYNLGISISKIGIPLIIIYLMADVGSVLGGMLSSFMICRGKAAVPARILSMLICALFVVPVFFASTASNLWMAVFYISLGIAGHQAFTANVWSLVMDMSPNAALGSIFGLGGMISAVAGMFMTQTVGYVLTATNNNYSIIFTMIPSFYILSTIWAYYVAPRKLETV